MRLRSRPHNGSLRAEFVLTASWIGEKYSLNPTLGKASSGRPALRGHLNVFNVVLSFPWYREAAIFPLYFWLPAAYSHAPAPVAALFAIMTKVGVYAIIRVTTLIFTGGEGDVMELTSPWLMPAALITLALALGTLGALGAQRLATMTAYLTIASVGTILTGVAAGGGETLAAALYYLAHSTLVIAVLFLVGDLLSRSRGATGDQLHPGPPLRQAVPLGLAFLFAGATVGRHPAVFGISRQAHDPAKHDGRAERRPNLDGDSRDKCTDVDRLLSHGQHRAVELC